MIRSNGLSRRGALKLGAAASALPLVHIRTAGAAGKLSIGFWDHWVPGGNEIMQKQVDAWAAQNKVEVQADFITGNGNQAQHDRRCRGAGQDRPRCADVLQLGRAQLRRRARADRRRDGADWSPRMETSTPTCAYLAKVKKPLDRSPDQQRNPDQATLRAHQLVQEARPRSAGDVSGPSRQDRVGRTSGPGKPSPKYAEAAQNDGLTFGLGTGRQHQHRRYRHARGVVPGLRRHSDRQRGRHPTQVRCRSTKCLSLPNGW